ncbi:MAG: DUF354 domain-containing protein [Candidatus Heimdallarchaeota archaeon]|nr:DUF354 domain-containing protein [Candidatus Heimdallarchaeota archaeon]
MLIDIGHPGHVHLFKNFAWIMERRGHDVLFTTREKEFEIDLLAQYGFKFISFGKKYQTTFGKLLGLLKFDLQMLFASLKFNPDIYLSHGSMYAAQIAWLLRKPHISFEDTFNFEQINLYKPFTSTILTSTYTHHYLGRKNIRYNGYHELAYLHPKRFKPDKKIFKELNLNDDEKFVLLRFVSWEASHDVGHDGITIENKLRAVQEFGRYAQVFISSEKELPEELKRYKINISPDRMHDVIAFASLVYGESATMVSEAAVLGTPGIFIDDTGRYYTTEQEQDYGLVFNYSESLADQNASIKKGVDILKDDTAEKNWRQKMIKILKDKIDVTSFLVWFVENYPGSVGILKEDPNYQLRFR